MRQTGNVRHQSKRIAEKKIEADRGRDRHWENKKTHVTQYWKSKRTFSNISSFQLIIKFMSPFWMRHIEIYSSTISIDLLMKTEGRVDQHGNSVKKKEK
ncbi:hypothetical protein ElyMa_000915400 [Elysia marginata]|uniref:Uncharacterized protein n=1 Tax=Elysia marginata TaxID=1093978 RepID=A0AAV4HBY9_9GAST|nr:hypothetical protein ElyMa_000915400 [Elysia marginata]